MELSVVFFSSHPVEDGFPIGAQSRVQSATARRSDSCRGSKVRCKMFDVCTRSRSGKERLIFFGRGDYGFSGEECGEERKGDESTDVTATLTLKNEPKQYKLSRITKQPGPTNNFLHLGQTMFIEFD
jgi:hypothetical protein